MGRPKEYNLQTLRKVCTYIIKGYTITDIARKLGINRQTIYKWKNTNAKFSEMYEEAQRIRAEDLMDEMLKIADNTKNDYLTNSDGEVRGNNTAVQRDKLKVKTRSTLLKWLDPSKYGDQSNIDITTKGKSLYQGLVITPPNIQEGEECDDDADDDDF